MIEINEMIIRVPGMGEEDGRRLGAEIAQRLLETMQHATESRHISELNVQLPAIENIGREQIADRITSQIIQQLKRT